MRKRYISANDRPTLRSVPVEYRNLVKIIGNMNLDGFEDHSICALQSGMECHSHDLVDAFRGWLEEHGYSAENINGRPYNFRDDARRADGRYELQEWHQDNDASGITEQKKIAMWSNIRSTWIMFPDGRILQPPDGSVILLLRNDIVFHVTPPHAHDDGKRLFTRAFDVEKIVKKNLTITNESLIAA